MDNVRSHISLNGVIEREERKHGYKGIICRDNKWEYLWKNTDPLNQ